MDPSSPSNLIEEVLKMDSAIQRAQDKLDIMRNDPELLHSYEMYELQLMDERNRLEGTLLDERIKIAKKALNEGLSIDLIMKLTELDYDIIKGLM
jgi:hypothetical protein